MNEKTRRSLSAFGKMVNFVKRHRITGGRVATALATLEGSIAAIDNLAPVQHIARSGRTYDAVARRNLRVKMRQDQMIPIARDGRPLFATEPAILRVLRVPHARASDAEVAAAAKAMIKALKPYAKLFVEKGYDKKFLTILATDARTLERWSTHTETTTSRRTAANVALRAELTRGRQAAGVLDALMVTYTRGNAAMAEEWAQSKRLGKRIGRPRAAKKVAAAPAS